MNKIYIETNGQKVTVETAEDVTTLGNLIDCLLIPCLLGLTYSDKTIAEYINSSMVDPYVPA